MGLPMAIIDLLGYLTGQYEQVKSAIELLKERVEPRKKLNVKVFG